MTDTSKDAVDRLVLAMIRSGTMWAADTLAALAVERDAANARADAAEYRIVHIAAGLFPGGFDNNVAAIRDALRDKPAPGVTVQEAAKALLAEWQDSKTTQADDIAQDEADTHQPDDFDASKIVEVWLRAIAGGGDE